MSSNNTRTTAVEKYFEQRVVTSGDATTLTIDDVHLDSTSKEIIVHGHVDTEHLELTVNVRDATRTKQDFLSWLYITDDGRIDPTHRVDDHIELVFDDETETFTHVQTECELPPSEITNEITDTDTETVTRELQQLFTRFAYELADPPHGKDHGLKCEVSDVVDPDGNSFIITAHPSHGVELQWSVEIPHVSDITNSSLETLIEEEGGGNPEFIGDGGEVVILHESDTTTGLDVIEYDESGEWGIIPPSTHKSWDETEDEEDEEDEESGVTSSEETTSSSSSSSSTSWESPSSMQQYERRNRGRRMIAQSVVLMLVMAIAQFGFSYATSGMTAAALNSPLFSTAETLIGVANAFVILPMVYGVFLFITGN